jgi:hypothetical protein
MGVMGEQPESFQKTGNGLSASVTLACYPPERLRRQYIIIISVQDHAGNNGSASIFVTVPHNQGQ